MVNFAGKRVAVIGDVMLDRFLEGKITRKSPEANAPVVLWQKESKVLGGAGNVAANIKSLGGKPLLYSIIGDDLTGESIKELLGKAKIDYRFMVDKKRGTTLKTRIFGSDKYLLRLDREVKDPIPKSLAVKLFSEFSKKINSLDAIAFADYNNGALTNNLPQKIITLAKKHKVPVVADVKPSNLARFKGVTVIKPNTKEAIKMTGITNLNLAAKLISKKLNSSVLITRGAKGVLLCLKGARKVIKIEGIKVSVKDIVGAGDVVSATLALGLASGNDLIEATKLANINAALSVQKHGTATVSIKEMIKFIAR